MAKNAVTEFNFDADEREKLTTKHAKRLLSSGKLRPVLEHQKGMPMCRYYS